MIESWRTADATGVADDPLQLLWLERDAARRPVTLTVAKGRRREEKTFEDAGWEMALAPALPARARAVYERVMAAEGDHPDAWDELERSADLPAPAGAWLAWRRGIAAAASVERGDEASAAFARARELAGRPEIVALLHAEEAQAFWLGTQYHRAGAPLTVAETALRELGQIPQLGLSLVRRARYLTWQGRHQESRAALDEAGQVLQANPRADVLHIELLVRRASLAWTEGYLMQAENAYRLASARFSRSEHPFRAEVCQSLGTLLREQGKYEEASEWYREGLAVGRATPWERNVAAGLNNSLGNMHKNLGNFERAEWFYGRALELFPSGGAAEAGISNNLGNLALNRGDLALAATYHRAALELRRAIQPESPSVASSTHNLGVVLRQQGEHAEAAVMFEGALALKTELVPDSLLLASTLRESGLNLLALGDHEVAKRSIARACDISRALAPDSLDHGRCELSLGDVSLALGHRQQAIDLWRQGLGVIERLRMRVPSEQGKARFSAQFDGHYRALASAYLEDGDAEQAFRTLEAARARMLRALLQQYGDQAALAQSPGLLAARRRVEARIGRTLRGRSRLHPSRDAARIREIQQQLQGLESQREELNERLYRSVFGLERIERMPAISIERVRGQLPVGSVGLLYALGPSKSHVFVVRGASPTVEAVELPVGRREIARQVDIFRGLLERGRVSATLETALIAQGHGLFETLLAPVIEHVEAASRLFIAPDTELNGLPFAALVRSREPLRFVAEWKPHAVVPSLTSLVELREGQVDRPEPDLEWVAVGAPDLSNPTSARARGLSALPGSQREIETLARLFGDRRVTLTGAEATEAATRAAMPRGRYVHFATHALLNRRFPMSSSLVLSSSRLDPTERDDGLLQGWEILEIPTLAAELVTLAGCETGRGAEWAGEGLIGLAQAFHYVGTPAILASQWRVGDAWVGALSEAFYRQLLAGESPMAALASAQRSLIASTAGPNAAMRHPYYWGAFTLFGVGE